MYRSYSSIETLERRSGETGTNILLIPSSSNNLSAQLDRPVGTRHHYCTRLSLKKTRSKGSGRRDVGLRRLVYRVFHRISRRVSTESGEWKRNKVLARTKSERDRCIIPVLLTAPPQSRSPALSSLFIPPSSAAPSKHTQQPLWVSFHPLWLCRLRPTATPAPPTFLRRFHRAPTLAATPPFFFFFFFTFLFARLLDSQATKKWEERRRNGNSRGYNESISAKGGEKNSLPTWSSPFPDTGRCIPVAWASKCSQPRNKRPVRSHRSRILLWISSCRPPRIRPLWFHARSSSVFR